MIANVCGNDRIIRSIIALILIMTGVALGNVTGWILGAIGLYLLFTAMMSYCFFKSLLGQNSCRVYIKDPLRDHEME